MPLAKAFGVKTKSHDPLPGQPRSLWQVFWGTSGDIEPEAARFIARETGKDPVTGKCLSAAQRQQYSSAGTGGARTVRTVQCIPIDTYTECGPTCRLSLFAQPLNTCVHECLGEE